MSANETDSYSEIGTLLRKAREEQGLTMQQAAHLLHIRLRYVEALEHGRLSELPGIVYTKGYLQAYAAFLGLDKDEVLRRFEQVEGALASRGFYFPQAFAREKTPSSIIVWAALGAALLIYVLWLIFLQPSRITVSVIDSVPEKPPEKVHVSAEQLQDVPCLQPQDVYYPACYQAQAPLPAMRGQLNTVMDLAKPLPL